MMFQRQMLLIAFASLALASPGSFTRTDSPKDPGAPQPKPAKPAEGGLADGDPMPEWSLNDVKGKEVSRASLQGRVVLLDFWATWCSPCRAAMPVVQKLHDRYKSKGLVVYGLNNRESEHPGGDPVKFMQEKHYTYGLILHADGVAKKFGVTGIPHIFLIGRDGKIVLQEIGFDAEHPEKEETRFASAIDRALAAPAPAPKP